VDLVPALGLLGLLLIKEAGVPIPVPGDLLVIGAGVAAAAAGGGVAALLLLLGILVAGYVGGTVQFLLVRGAFRAALLGILRRAGVSEARLDALAGFLRRRGAVGVATARATPAVRIGAIAASGLAGLALPPFLAGLIVGNGLFVGAHFALGLVVGPPAIAAVSASSGPILGVVAFIVLAVIGALGWRWLQARRAGGARGGEARTRPGAARTGPGDDATGPGVDGTPTEAGPGEAADERSWLSSVGSGAWSDAACPACLAISLVTGDRS
jgi:membrane protein DedA with SNARE-associated domain